MRCIIILLIISIFSSCQLEIDPYKSVKKGEKLTLDQLRSSYRIFPQKKGIILAKNVSYRSKDGLIQYAPYLWFYDSSLELSNSCYIQGDIRNISNHVIYTYTDENLKSRESNNLIDCPPNYTFKFSKKLSGIVSQQNKVITKMSVDTNFNVQIVFRFREKSLVTYPFDKGGDLSDSILDMYFPLEEKMILNIDELTFNYANNYVINTIFLDDSISKEDVMILQKKKEFNSFYSTLFSILKER